jgi:8-oxo-dGTP pyrophosphatase MutT (NUDIX family)
MIADVDAQRARLARALERYAAADDAEDEHRLATLDLVRETKRCFDRHLYRPGHVVGSAFIVDLETETVLLRRHARLGRWLQVGGHDENEHDPLATAMREAHEESGLTDLTPISPLILDIDVHVVPAGRGEPTHRHFDIRYGFETARPEEANGTPGVAWFSLAEADRLMMEPGAARALRKLGAILASFR